MQKIDRAGCWARALSPLLAVAGLSLLFRLWNLAHGLPFLVHPDEQPLVRRALRMASGDLNPHFFYYPSFSMYVYFVMDGFYFVAGRLLGFFQSSHDMALHFVRNPSGIFLSNRLVIAGADTLTTLAVFQVARRVMDRPFALLASLLWALSSLAVLTARVAKPDSLMAFLAAAALALLFSARTRRCVFLTGLVLGLAISSKYPALMLGPGFALWLLLQPHPPRERALRVGLLSAGVALGFVMGTPFSVLAPAEFWHDFSEQMTIMKVGFTGAEGGDLAWKAYVAMLSASAWNWVFLAVAAVGLVGLLVRERTVGLVFAALLLLPMANFLRQRIGAPHYLICLLPFYLIVVAHGVSWVGSVTRQRWAATALAVLLVGGQAWAAARTFREMSAPDSRVEAGRWILQNLPVAHAILMDPAGPALPMARKQLDDLHRRAVAAGHLKADYFALQRQAQTGEGYVIFYPEWPVNVMPPDLLAQARVVQDLVPIMEGTAALRRAGIDYVIVTRGQLNNSEVYAEKYPGLGAFFAALEKEAALLKEFGAEPGRPDVRIFSLRSSPGAS